MLKPINLPDDHKFDPVDFTRFIDTTQKFWFNLLENYRYKINENFSKEYAESPECFPYMKKLEAIALFKNHDIVFHIYENTCDAFSYVSLQFPTYKELRIYSEMTEVERDKYKQQLCNKETAPFIVFDIKYGYQIPTLIPGEFEVTENPEDLPEMGKTKGITLANEHYNLLSEEKKNRFSLFELENFIPKINDEHFHYEIEEAIKAYRNELYLASTAVIGVALENLLSLIIIKMFDEEKLPKRKYIKDYINVLVKEGLIDNRAGRRYDNFSDTRNGAAHSNSGKIYKEDAEQGFELIKQLIIEFSPHISQ